MNKPASQITQLLSIRNRFGKQFASEKLQLLNAINIATIRNKTALQSFYTALLFLIAYPDNKTIYKTASQLLQQLQQHIQANEKLKYSLYNTGITGTSLCAAFSFEMVKWLRETHHDEIKFISFEADDAKIQSILSVVMSKAESEIFQDANAECKGWLKQLKKPDEDLIDQLIEIFNSSDIQPKLKEELWNTIGINVEINFALHCCLPSSLIKLYYHRALIRKQTKKQTAVVKQVKLTENEAEQIIDCARMILLRKLRELDPISFTSVKHVSLYDLQGGISIALMGMAPHHRHPIDSYMGYVVFKNGLPVSYAGSWILFNSGRMGLNVFADYRGGEARYIFDQILQLHTQVYRLKRFTIDPYQVGKENYEGINSGAFWFYYHAGFRPLKKEQIELAIEEELKIKAGKKYRSPVSVLKTLANSRLELVLQKSAVNFDATDLSRAYAGIITKKYNGNRSLAEKGTVKKIADILLIKNYKEGNMNYILKSWGVLLLSNEKELRSNTHLRKTLKKLFVLKAGGSEEAYITALQQSSELRNFVEGLVKEYVVD